jgi:Putative DNA-binding domain
MTRQQRSLVDKALSDARESRQVAFKRELDVNSTGEWLEIIKDIVAMANSGGGAIAVGLDDLGEPSKWDPTPLLRHDPALLKDKLAVFTGEQFDDVAVVERRKGRRTIAVILVGERTGAPLIFEKDGSYRAPDGTDRCVFSKGSVYFRHGPRSEPGRSRDVRRFAKREEDRMRREFVSNIRKVSTAPSGAEVLILNRDAVSRIGASGVRVIDDPNAPTVGVIDSDQTHPFLFNELLRILRRRIGTWLTSYDLFCVRNVHKIDRKPEFFHKPLHGSPQYSQSYVDWLVEEYRKDDQFFVKAREQSKT